MNHNQDGSISIGAPDSIMRRYSTGEQPCDNFKPYKTLSGTFEEHYSEYYSVRVAVCTFCGQFHIENGQKLSKN